MYICMLTATPAAFKLRLCKSLLYLFKSISLTIDACTVIARCVYVYIVYNTINIKKSSLVDRHVNPIFVFILYD